MAVVSSVLDLIGNTPMVDVSRLSPNPDVRILAKMEGQNPAGSVKDRIALQMITEAEADGTLTPGKTLIEPSSGNTGIALAMIAKLKGYPIKIVLPENVSIERRQLLEVCGAEIISSPGAEGSNGAVRKAQALAGRTSRLGLPVPVRQRGQPPRPLPNHRSRDLARLPRDHPLRGRARHQRHADGGRAPTSRSRTPTIQVIAVEPPLGEKVEGLRNLDEGYIPPVYEKWGGPELLDRKRVVRPRESHRVDASAERASGSSPGSPPGPPWPAAPRWPATSRPAPIVFIVADYGWKYLSTGAWTDDIDEVVTRAEKIIYF